MRVPPLRLLAISSLFVFCCAAGALQAAPPEQARLTLAVGGKGLFYYLPLTIAERRGYFRDEGLELDIVDFAGGAKSLQAVVGGSAQFAAGSFEHLLRLQAKGQRLRAVALLARYPAMVLALSTRAAASYRDWPDLKGLKIGVTAPGSSTHLFLNRVLSLHGLAPDDVAVIGVGATASAVSALQRGDIDGLVHLDPVIHALEAGDRIRVLVDTRTEEGASAVYGGAYHAACLYAKAEFIDAHPNTTQALVNGQVRALRWLATASLEDIVATVPETYHGGDRAAYAAALAKNRGILSPDGRLADDGARHVLQALEALEPALAEARVDIGAAIDNRYVARVPAATE